MADLGKHADGGVAPSGRAALAARGHETRTRLLETGERLIAERGIDGVSMRQIGLAVGQGNNSVIQYHFDSKEGLVSAIIARRAAQLEPTRRAMLDAAKAAGKTGDVATLLAILFLPIASIRDEAGHHVYAAFMLNGLGAIWVSSSGAIAHSAWSGGGPVEEVMAYLRQCRPELSEAQMRQRILRLSRLLVHALVDWDKAGVLGAPRDPEDYLRQDIINMATAAFAAPLPPTNPAEDGPEPICQIARNEDARQ